MAPESWLNTNHPYEINSVMHYSSKLHIRNPPYIVMTHKDDGSTFDDGRFMTTTDSLQVDEMYCKQLPQYKTKACFQNSNRSSDWSRSPSNQNLEVLKSQ